MIEYKRLIRMLLTEGYEYLIDSLKNPNKILRTSDLIFYLINARNSNYISVPDYLIFMEYLYRALSEKGIISEYEIAFISDIYSLKRSVQYNVDLFKDASLMKKNMNILEVFKF